MSEADVFFKKQVEGLDEYPSKSDITRLYNNVIAEVSAALYLGQASYSKGLLEKVTPYVRDNLPKRNSEWSPYYAEDCLIDIGWLIRYAEKGHFPYVFQKDRFDSLTDEEKNMLIEGATFYLSGLERIDFLEQAKSKKNIQDTPLSRQFGHPDYLSEIALGKLKLHTGRYSDDPEKRGNNFSENGRNYHINGLCSIQEIIELPEDLTKRVFAFWNEHIRNKNYGHDIDIIRQKLELEKEGTDFYVELRLV